MGRKRWQNLRYCILSGLNEGEKGERVEKSLFFACLPSAIVLTKHIFSARQKYVRKKRAFNNFIGFSDPLGREKRETEIT